MIPKLQQAVLTPANSLFKAALFSLPMLLLTALLLLHGLNSAGPLKQIAVYLTYIFVNSIFFLMIYTGHTYKYRSLFFVIYSLCFVLSNLFP